jgi:DNA mismatch endonuclease, patch repair protein
VDNLDKEARSLLMSKVKSRGNKSTEIKVEDKLLEQEINLWIKHPKGIFGNPDFYFPNNRLALFVDGCFWHGCKKCCRNIPKTRSDYWIDKISKNTKRDNKIRRVLRKEGYHIMRIWEHDLKRDIWIKRLRNIIRRTQNESINY